MQVLVTEQLRSCRLSRRWYKSGVYRYIYVILQTEEVKIKKTNAFWSQNSHGTVILTVRENPLCAVVLVADASEVKSKKQPLGKKIVCPILYTYMQILYYIMIINYSMVLYD